MGRTERGTRPLGLTENGAGLGKVSIELERCFLGDFNQRRIQLPRILASDDETFRFKMLEPPKRGGLRGSGLQADLRGLQGHSPALRNI